MLLAYFLAAQRGCLNSFERLQLKTASVLAGTGEENGTAARVPLCSFETPPWHLLKGAKREASICWVPLF